jgi:hypothetical protein
MSLPLYNVAPDPSGSDDTAALQAAIDGTPDGGCLMIPPAACYTVSAPLSIYSRDGLCIRSLGSPDTRRPGQRGAEFLWKGPTGAGAVFDVNYSRKVIFQGLTLSCDGNATPPARGFRFDQWMDSAKPKPTVNCTACRVSDCLVIAPPVAGNFYGVSISEVSGLNCEYMVIENCTITSPGSQTGWGDGVRVGPSANAKGIQCRNVSVSWANVGLHWQNGSGHVSGCTGTGNAVCVQFDTFVDPSSVRDCNFELAGQFLFANGQDAPLTLEGNRCVVTGPYVFNLRNRQTILRGNRFTGTPAAPVTQVQGFTPYPGSGYGMSRDGNLWSAIDVNDGWFGSRTVGGLDWQRSY